jgi:hypothetical protein
MRSRASRRDCWRAARHDMNLPLSMGPREAIRDAKAELERHERTMVESGGDLCELGEFCYYDIPEIGSLIELLYVTELLPP